MKFEIRIKQDGEYGCREIIRGVTDSYEDAVSLMNLILSMCSETEVELTATANNKKESEAK